MPDACNGQGMGATEKRQGETGGGREPHGIEHDRIRALRHPQLHRNEQERNVPIREMPR
jgi:hypothetical protein